MAGHNAYWNNATNYYAGETYIDLTANDVVLAADPFTNAAGADFSLTDAAKAALAQRGSRWPFSARTPTRSQRDHRRYPAGVRHRRGGAHRPRAGQDRRLTWSRAGNP
jgi:hypothetical protein